MKRFVLIGWVLLSASVTEAQVFFRNDFLINSKQHKVENLGLRFISFNVSNRPNWNQLINGRGGETLVVDVRALREPYRRYTYREIAEKVYVPAKIRGPQMNNEVPAFLLQQPPDQRRFEIPSRRVFFR